jgi:4'-phosphopantetheinyl transferase
MHPTAERGLSVDEVRVYTANTGERERVRQVARVILAQLIGTATSDEIVFDYLPQGKPVLRNDAGLHFSISHAGDVSMIAVTRVAPIGVDVEIIRAVPQAEAILRRFFSEDETASVLSDDRREFRFATAWTRAEATVKVRGASVWELATPDPSVTVREITAPDGYVAAVAVAAPEWVVTQYAFEVYRDL